MVSHFLMGLLITTTSAFMHSRKSGHDAFGRLGEYEDFENFVACDPHRNGIPALHGVRRILLLSAFQKTAPLSASQGGQCRHHGGAFKEDPSVTAECTVDVSLAGRLQRQRLRGCYRPSKCGKDIVGLIRLENRSTNAADIDESGGIDVTDLQSTAKIIVGLM